MIAKMIRHRPFVVTVFPLSFEKNPPLRPLRNSSSSRTNSPGRLCPKVAAHLAMALVEEAAKTLPKFSIDGSFTFLKVLP